MNNPRILINIDEAKYKIIVSKDNTALFYLVFIGANVSLRISIKMDKYINSKKSRNVFRI